MTVKTLIGEYQDLIKWRSQKSNKVSLSNACFPLLSTVMRSYACCISALIDDCAHISRISHRVFSKYRERITNWWWTGGCILSFETPVATVGTVWESAADTWPSHVATATADLGCLFHGLQKGGSFMQAGARWCLVTTRGHDDVIKSWWKHFPRHWPFVRGVHGSPVNSPQKGQWRRAFDVFFDLRPNKRLGTQSRCRWFETLLCSLWRHCNVKTRCYW